MEPFTPTDVADLARAEAGALEHELESPGGEVGQVAGQIEAVPGMAEPAEGEGVDVRDGDDKPAARHEQAVRGRQDLRGLVNVFERLPHGDEVETLALELRVGQGAANRPQAKLGLHGVHD